jgi:hypothetical protein
MSGSNRLQAEHSFASIHSTRATDDQSATGVQVGEVTFDDLHPASQALFNRVKQRVTSFFGAYFDRADQVLLASFQNATQHDEKMRHLQAVNNLRFRREQLISGFLTHLEKVAARVSSKYNDHPVHPVDQAGFNSGQSEVSRSVYGYGGDKAYESYIAVEAMVAQTKHRCWEQLYYLDIHQNSVFPSDSLSHSLSARALDPVDLCQLFHDISVRFNLCVESRLLFYSLFERGVLKELNAMMQITNRWLQTYGVEPAPSPEDFVEETRIVHEQSTILFLMDQLFKDAHRVAPDIFHKLTLPNELTTKPSGLIRFMPVLSDSIKIH